MSANVSSVLGGVVYSTDLETYLGGIGNKIDLLTIMAFRNIGEVAPALTNREHEDLFDHLMESRSLPYIPEYNILRLHAELPSDILYPLLSKITVDEMNLNQVLIMVKNGNFPALNDLTIYTGGDLNFTGLPRLSRLCLYNMTAEVLTIPEIPSEVTDSVEHLELSGYRVKFEGRLPKYLLLSQCAVLDSSDLLGCETLILNETVWEKPSYPSKYLHVEDSLYTGQPPLTLEELHLVGSQVEMKLTGMSDLRVLTMLNLRADTSVVGRELNIKELVASFSDLDQAVDLSSVTKLALTGYGGIFPSTLALSERMPKVREVLVHDAQMDLRAFMKCLPLVTSLRATKCSFEVGLVLRETLPPFLKKLEFYECGPAETLVEVDCIEDLVLCGKGPSISAETPPSSLLVSRTMAPLMTSHEFELYCIEHMMRGDKRVFEDHNVICNDLLCARHWDRSRLEKLATLFSYTFVVRDPDAATFGILLRKGRENSVVLVGNHSLTVRRLQELYETYRDTQTIPPNMEQLSVLFQNIKP